MLHIKQFIFNPFQENTYVLIDETKTCAIVDPGNYTPKETLKLKSFIAENQLKVKMILLTHGHFDHIFGLHALIETQNIPVYANILDKDIIATAPQYAQRYGFSFPQSSITINHQIEDGETLTIGQTKLLAVHLPGHSKGSMFFYIPDNKIAIVGDILFKGSIGRTDLPGGNLDELLDGIHKKLFTLPSETKVLSGHGPSTSIETEKRTNPFVSSL
ncbi:MAG TPA: MBL fold metallo-hydrolase [Bacteroidales bacterium]|nr:MBL fold metallo-hydrolase [Bacteroidales bacterium]